MYQRVVLAFDGSVEGRAALAEGMTLAAMCSADVHLLSVLEIADASGFGEGLYALDEFNDGSVAWLRALVDEGLSQLRSHQIAAPRGHVAFGNPAEQIARLAEQVGADLVVVGHRHRGLLARWWQGSLSRTLIDQVNCSVLVAMN